MIFKNLTVNLKTKWTKLKSFMGCFETNTLEKESTEHPITLKPTPKEMLEPQIQINKCCEICSTCYMKLTSRTPNDNVLIKTAIDSQYWFSKAMLYRGKDIHDNALLHYLEYNIVKLNDIELFHKWLIRLQESENSWEMWDDLISGKKYIYEFFNTEPNVKIHDTENLKRLSGDFQVLEMD
jgi:hypothetical protein